MTNSPYWPTGCESWPITGFPWFRLGTRVVEPTDYLTELRLVVEEMEPALIVIDPLAHFFACDENSNTEMAAAMNHLKRLTDSGGVLLLNHHTSKARAYEADSAAGRGASAIRDGLRAVFFPDPRTMTPFSKRKGVVCLSHTKSNYAARMSCPIFLKRHQTGGARGNRCRFRKSKGAVRKAKECSRSTGERNRGKRGEPV